MHTIGKTIHSLSSGSSVKNGARAITRGGAWIAMIGAVFASGPDAQAFYEEGWNMPAYLQVPFSRCATYDNLVAAQKTGCNPWNDSDANYSLSSALDMPKSSVHFNATAAMAIAAGFDACHAYALAVYDAGADVADRKDQLFWAPIPGYINVNSACASQLAQEGITIKRNYKGVPGMSVIADFTHRSSNANDPNHEKARESMTFHWNPTLTMFQSTTASSQGTDCNAIKTSPAIYTTNLVTLDDLYAWSTTSSSDALNQCSGYPSDKRIDGPITAYDQINESIQPSSLGSFGTFLHAYQDAHSHRAGMEAMIAQGKPVFAHTNKSAGNDLDTKSASGMVSGHYAGEFGTIRGNLGQGLSTDVIMVNDSGVTLHSQDTANALAGSYQQMVAWLKVPGHEKYLRKDAVTCSSSILSAFAAAFAEIPNVSQTPTTVSGAKQRSDLADSLFANLAMKNSCSWNQ